MLSKLKSRGLRATSLSTYGIWTLHTTLPYMLIRVKHLDLIECIFKRDGTLYLACKERTASFTFSDQRRYKRR